MHHDILPAEDLISEAKEFREKLLQQIELRSQNGSSDARLTILSKSLIPLKFHAMLNTGNLVEPVTDGGIGSVVRKSGANGAVTPSPGTATPAAAIGTVIKTAAVDTSKQNQPTPATKSADDDFMLQLKALSVEQLSSSRFSKEALLQIVKKLNGKGAGLNVTVSDNKATIAQEILNHLNHQ